jgi:predicted RNA-binding Zn-ribbon protein involved in translation (DUF1610 family)
LRSAPARQRLEKKARPMIDPQRIETCTICNLRALQIRCDGYLFVCPACTKKSRAAAAVKSLRETVLDLGYGPGRASEADDAARQISRYHAADLARVARLLRREILLCGDTEAAADRLDQRIRAAIERGRIRDAARGAGA